MKKRTVINHVYGQTVSLSMFSIHVIDFSAVMKEKLGNVGLKLSTKIINLLLMSRR